MDVHVSVNCIVLVCVRCSATFRYFRLEKFANYKYIQYYAAAMFSTVLVLVGLFLLTADALHRTNNLVEYGGFIRFLFCCVRLYEFECYLIGGEKGTQIPFENSLLQLLYYIHSEREAIPNSRCHQWNENSLFGIFIVEMFQKLLQFGYSTTFYIMYYGCFGSFSWMHCFMHTATLQMHGK